MAGKCPFDGFGEARAKGPVLPARLDGDTIPMILRNKDVRRAARDWKTYSSDAPFRVPIPSEEHLRSIRQLPIETDPPEHGAWRALIEPFFNQPKDPDYAARIEELIDTSLDEALAVDSLEIVWEFALPLQSRALTHLLKMPESEADLWISWGTHVFDKDDENQRGSVLDIYLEEAVEKAAREPGEDIFSVLLQSKFQGRPLTKEEVIGFGNLAFAGGRDTVIASISALLGYLARHPDALEWLREDEKRIVPAVEEIFRTTSPITHIGRVCPVDTNVHGVEVPADGRVSLSWASANFDENVFDHPEEVHLDRKPNPHVAFGSGHHSCIGAPHARLILRTLARRLCAKVARMEILEESPLTEERPDYERRISYSLLKLRFSART